ncbi:MAG TPA: cytochrome C oxidase subunit IV family protein [Candidatus Polarisedimenticolia bacterium]|nr:cytochrome C oxidase subunit IV family protein [Candidatus Polarisedimenticolia bacterium]
MSEHIVSPKLYFAIFAALILGTGITVWAAFQNFGPFNIVIALGIATIKATLVVLYFMHARYSPGRTQLVIVCSVFWLAIMLALTLADYDTRPHDITLAAPQVFYCV